MILKEFVGTSMGSHRVGHDWSDLAAAAAVIAVVHPGWLSGKEFCMRMQETQETRIESVGQEDPPEEKMATNSSILAREIPWTEEPGRLLHGVAKSRTSLSHWVQHTHLSSLTPFFCHQTLGNWPPEPNFRLAHHYICGKRSSLLSNILL